MNAASETTMDPTIMMLLTTFLIPVIGILMAITPYLMRKNECFAVTVPESALKDSYLQSLKRRYALIMLVTTALLTALGLVFSLTNNTFGAFAVVIVGSLGICLGGYILMLYYRKKVQVYKKQQNWRAEKQETIAFVGDENTPQAISLKWSLLYLPIFFVTAAIGYAGYALMPDMIAMQVGFDGDVSRWVAKTPSIIWVPVLIQAFVAAACVFSHWMITKSKKNASPQKPATSALAYGMFAHAQSIFLLVTGLLVCALMTVMPLSFMGIIPLMQAAAIIMIGVFVIVIGALAISVVYGQGGARLFARMQESDALLADNDEHWKVGIFYFNKQDPSLFLLERFGVGWTINWARPAAWAIILGFIGITVAFIAAIIAIA